MKRVLIFFFFLLISFSIKSQSKSRILHGGLRHERTCFDVIFYDLHVKIDPSQRIVSGFNEIFFKVLDTTHTIQLDLFANMDVDSIIYKNEILKYNRKFGAVFINFPQKPQVNSIQSLKFFYHGSPQTNIGPNGDSGFHWDKDDKGNPLIGVSCEDVGASLWYPNKDHLSDEPDSARLHWTVPDNLVCISNGRLEKTEFSELNYKTWTWFVRNPINNYGISFYLGNYKKLKIKLKDENIEREIECYYYSNDLETAKKYFLPSVNFVRFCEKYFGEYPFWDDKFAIVQASYRGMEHQGCVNIGNEISGYNNWSYLYDVPWHATLVHEIAHEWWGNSVSVSDIADMWLHEGFATYTEMLYIEYIYGKAYYEKSILNLNKLITSSSPIIGERNVYCNIFINNNIYFKGALFLHALRSKINNDEIFFKILKTFQSRFRKKIVTTNDFLIVVNELSGKNFDEFFKRKLY